MTELQQAKEWADAMYGNVRGVKEWNNHKCGFFPKWGWEELEGVEIVLICTNLISKYAMKNLQRATMSKIKGKHFTVI